MFSTHGEFRQNLIRIISKKVDTEEDIKPTRTLKQKQYSINPNKMRNFHNNPPIGKRRSFKVRNIPVPLPQGKCTKSVHFCLLQFLFTRKIFRKLLLLFRRIRIRTQDPEPHNVDLLTPSWW